MATTSLVFGLLAFLLFFVGPLLAIVAIITGALAKKAVNGSHGTRTGRSTATTGVVLGIVNLGLTAAVIGLIVLGHSLAGNHVRYTELRTGDCFNQLGPVGEVIRSDVERLPCTTAHHMEMVGSFQADPGPYPGLAGLGVEAHTRCAALANDYLGTASGDGPAVYWLGPLQVDWNRNRTVVCSVQNRDGSTRTGSVRG